MLKLSKIIILWAIIAMPLFVKCQTSVNSIGNPVSENFNSLTTSNIVSPWNQNLTLSGWVAYEMDPYSKAIDFSADSGTGSTGRLYSYGRASRADRALGSLCSSANDTIVYAWRLKNNTAARVDSVKISFTGEQWRKTSGTAANKLLFFYKVGSGLSAIDSITIRNLTGKGFAYYPGLDFSSPQTGSATSLLNGNDPANSKFLSKTIAVTIAPEEEIMFLWLDDDEVGNDHGLAIDDISVTFLINPYFIPLVAIDSIKQNDTNGVNKKLNSKVEIRGTVYGINYETAGLQFVIRDATNGIVAYSPIKTFGYSVNEGDSLHLIGKVIQTEGMSILLIDTLFAKGKSKIKIKSPILTKFPGENYEADLFKINNFKTTKSYTVWPKDEYLKFIKGTDTISVFIDKETDIDSAVFPVSNSYSITGFVFQSSKSSRLDDGYFIVPRSLKDIQFVSPPQVSFKQSDIYVKENDTAFVEVKILHPDSNSTSVTIIKKGGTAMPGSDYSSYFPQTITFPPLSDSSQIIGIPLVNDVFDEPDKTLELVLRNINNGGKISGDSIVIVTIEDNDNPLYPIKLVSKINNFGVPDSNNGKVQVQGIVYGINYRPTGLQFTLRDSSGGIGIFNPVGNFGYEVTEGDEILVSGTIGHFRGFAQLSFIDTILKLSSGGILKSPVVVSQLDEFSESNLVKINRLHWAQQKPTTWVANSTYKFTNGNDTFQVRIDGDIDLAGIKPPTYDTLNITGIGGQVSTVSAGPFLDGYLLYPRYISDIEKWDQSSGIEKASTNFVSVFPNPNNGNFVIISSKPINDISIFSTTGEIVFNSKIPNLLQKSLDLNLVAGVYILKVVLGNVSAFNRIIIE